MSEFVQAIQFSDLDEARRVLEQHCRYTGPDIFEDKGEEPQGLLSIVPADRVPEEVFYRFFDADKGTFLTVQVVSYSGFGPPADEHAYMGFISEKKAYVLEGRKYHIEIDECPHGAVDIYHLEAQVLEGEHPFDRAALEARFSLPPGWDFEDLADLVARGEATGTLIDRFLHRK